MGKGGGSSKPAPTSQTVTQTNLPEYAKPYYLNLMNRAQALSYTPYQAYGGQRIAGFTPEQQALQAETLGLQTPEQFGQAAQGAAATGLMGLDTAYRGLNQAFGYQPGQFNAGYQAMGYGPSGFSADSVQAPQLTQYQMRGPRNVYAERAGSDYFNPAAAGYYMSPYIEEAIAPQLREARLAGDVAKQRGMLGSIAGGTFGGSRQALLQAEQERGTQQLMSDIVGKGYQGAYENAQKQFEADQQRQMAAQQLNVQSGLQAALANQGMGYQTGLANLQALLGTQQLGAGQNLQAQLANQQYGLNAQQLAEQSRQFGATFGESSAARAAQYAMAEQQAREQAGQYAAGLGKDLGLAGMQYGLGSSQLLGQLGSAEQQADLARLQAQQQTAAQPQALQQQQLDLAYQDFLRQQQYPMDMLGFYSSMLRGIPIQPSTATQMYQQPPSLASQLTGLGLAGVSLGKLSGAFAKGGEVKNDYSGGVAGLGLYKALAKD